MIRSFYNINGKYSLKRLFNNIYPEIHLIVTTCGGIIESERGIISFLENEEYTNNLRCAWTIRSPLFSKNLYMTKLFSGFELGYDYLAAFGFNSDDKAETVM